MSKSINKTNKTNKTNKKKEITKKVRLIEEDEEDNKDIINEDKDITNKDNGEKIILQLGDIIQITNPLNDNLNGQIFFIEYIDSSKVYLVNTETLEKTKLNIKDLEKGFEMFLKNEEVQKRKEKDFQNKYLMKTMYV